MESISFTGQNVEVDDRPLRGERREFRLGGLALVMIPVAIPAFIALYTVSPVAAIGVAALFTLIGRFAYVRYVDQGVRQDIGRLPGASNTDGSGHW